MAEKSSTGSGPDAYKGMFTGLVMMLGSSAMQQLGKIVDPSSGKASVSLEGAQSTIDLLEMLQAKTCGNLDAEEEKMLRDLLASLQMNYVQVAAASKSSGTSDAAKTPESSKAGDLVEPEKTSDASPEKDADRTKSEPSKSTDEKREPRFHKSYGA